MTLQLVGQLITYPKGSYIRVSEGGQVHLLGRFVVLDTDDDVNVPLILGRPFLATGETKYHCEKGRIDVEGK